MEVMPSPPHGRGAGAPVGLAVFLAGAGVMALEIVGSRVLAPHFGHSIFVWGSLIGSFLVSIGLGYLAGGALSRRSVGVLAPSVLLALAGAFTLLLPLWAAPLCRAIAVRPEGAWAAGPRLGPLLACALLFGPPSLLASMLVPLAVRLRALDVESVGQVAGRLYALGSLGSILGTFATAFWLIPSYGTRANLTGIGATLLAGAVVGLPWGRHAVGTRRGRGDGSAAGRVAGGLVWLCLLAACGARMTISPPPLVSLPTEDRVEILAERDTAYERVVVTRASNWADADGPLHTVSLWFGRAVQGSVFDHPVIPRGRERWTALLYPELLHLHRLFVPEPRSMLLLGGGVGVVPRAMLRALPELQLDVVELDPALAALAEQHFFGAPDPRVQRHLGDGRAFLRLHPERRWDVIVVDVFDGEGRPPFHMLTREFYSEARARLSPGGVLLAVSDGALAGAGSALMASQAATLRAVFETVYLFPGYHMDDEPPRRASWPPAAWTRRRDAVFVATLDPHPIDADTRRGLAERLWAAARAPGLDYWTSELFNLVDHAANGLGPEAWPARSLPGGAAVAQAVLLTDDYAPVETLRFRAPWDVH